MGSLFETSLHSGMSLAALAAAVVAGGLVVAGIRGRGAGRAVAVGLGLLLLLPSAYLFLGLNAWIVDARFRTYRSLYQDIEVGMTRADVWDLVASHYPAGGRRQAPTVVSESATELGFFMHPEHSAEPNCEGIFLKLQNERVTAKSYSPD